MQQVDMLPTLNVTGKRLCVQCSSERKRLKGTYK